MEQKDQEDDRVARDRIRYQWMLDSVSKFRLLFVGLVFAILSFSVQFSDPTANRGAKGCQLVAWILLLSTGMLSLREAGGFVAMNTEIVFDGLSPARRRLMWWCFLLAIVLLAGARFLSDWAT